jgi:radical SAM protein with 4Fe4S-binding SPASM domain
MCPDPFNGISISSDGDISMCSCAMWHPTVIGNILDNTLEEMLNSELAQDIRQSIRNGTYEYCDETKCGIIINNKLLHESDLQGDYLRQYKNPTVIDFPRYFYIAGDQICNLSCPSCRTSVITLDNYSQNKNKNVMTLLNQQVFSGTSSEVISIYVSHAGEMMASPLLLNFLEEFPLDRYPQAEFWFQSNGLLIKNRWHRISHLADNIFKLSVTADSCNKTTYEKLRRGGTFENLIENLDFITELRKTYKFQLSLRMVVQAENMHEIEDFYTFAMKYDCTEVEYMRIQDWGTYSQEEFNSIDVLNPIHVSYQELIQRFSKLKSQYKNVVFYHFNTQ